MKIHIVAEADSHSQGDPNIPVVLMIVEGDALLFAGFSCLVTFCEAVYRKQ